MNITRTLCALLPVILIAACAPAMPPGGSVRAGKPPKYTPPVTTPYGAWWIDPQSCTIRASAADFTLQTDGQPENGVIYLKAMFTSPLVSPPLAEVSELLAPVPVEGTRRGYNVILAYDAANAAHMLKPDTYLIVRYQPLTSTQVLESSFATHGLMFALANLSRTCK